METRLTTTLLTVFLLALGSPQAADPDDTTATFARPTVRGSGGGGTIHLPPPATDEDFFTASNEKIELGRMLFFDKILSGNRNISCATCHHALTDTGDGLSLPLGEGADGLGVTRHAGDDITGVRERVPRNAPPVFNLGAHEFTRMFHDGRLEEDVLHPSGYRSPADLDLPEGLESALAAQAMFPVTSAEEMAGHDGENAVAHATAAGNLAGPGGVWELLAQRLRDNDEYVQMFVDVFEDVSSAEDITFVHAANAIAAFEGAAWRAADSPFDRFLRGDRHAMSLSAQKGMRLFFGAAGCASCHQGVFQTDHQFHAVAMPQIGPGKGDGPDGLDDYGRERVTGNPADRYKFRTPSLRNVALTAPYGHDGAYDTLEAVVRHQLDPVEGLDCYDTGQAVLPSRPDLDAENFVVHDDPSRRAEIASLCELDPVQLTETQFGQLLEFLHALTDPGSVDLRWDVPARVPSGASLVE